MSLDEMIFGYTIFYSDTKDDFCSVCGLLYEGRRK